MDTKLFINYLTLNEPYKNPENWTDDTHQTIAAHGTFLNDLGKQGILVFAGRSLVDFDSENLFGIAVIKASSIDDAKHILKQDPALIANIQQSVILPFSMGIQYFNNI